MDPHVEPYKFLWAIEAAAKERGWHRTSRKVRDRKVILTFEKDNEPEPGEGKDSA